MGRDPLMGAKPGMEPVQLRARQRLRLGKRFELRGDDGFVKAAERFDHFAFLPSAPEEDELRLVLRSAGTDG